MSTYDLFNGDADGILSLVQLRLADPRPEAKLITGVKRDIKLFSRINPKPRDQITALDISMRTNADGLRTALKAGADVFYVDHHNAGDIPDHPNLRAVINTKPDVCTALLVDRALNGASRAWAVCGAYGDNLDEAAVRRAEGLELPLPQLRQLGRMVNYNAYGATLDDLHYNPADLFRALLPYKTPMDFLHSRMDILDTLQDGYNTDMAKAHAATIVDDSSAGIILALKDNASSRRISGILGNDKATHNPGIAHAILTEKRGGYLVSVRAPKTRPKGADTLCLGFETGGGRAAAAGINLLKTDDLTRFVDAFRAQFAP